MRSAVPLITAAPLTDLRSGVEVFVVETRLEYPAAEGASAYQEHGLTVLVLMNPDEAARRWVRTEAPRYTGARTWIEEFPGDAWAAPVVEHLLALEPAFLDIVIGLHEPTDHVVLQVSSLMEQLRTDGRHHLDTVVAVTVPAVVRPATAVPLGWVAARDMPAAEGAILLHAGLAQLSAPDLIDEVYAEGLAEVWGSAEQPACLVVSDAEQLRHVQVPQGGGPTAVFCLVSPSFAQYRTVVRDLRTAGAESPLIVAAARLTLPGRALEGCPCVIVTAGGRVDEVTKSS